MAAPALVGAGMRKLSMSEGAAAAVKETLCGCSTAECRELLERVCAAGCADDAEKILASFHNRKAE